MNPTDGEKAEKDCEKLIAEKLNKNVNSPVFKLL